MRRARLTLAALVAATALLALPAEAKNGVRAHLDRPFNIDAAPGSAVRVHWRLVDRDGNPFGASGIYLRVSRCGAGPLRIRARHKAASGRFWARFVVPRRGIRKLMVGLEGWRTYQGKTTRADAIFNFVPALGRDCD